MPRRDVKSAGSGIYRTCAGTLVSMFRAAKRAVYPAISIAWLCCAASAQTSQSAKIQHYIDKANREAWGIVDPDKQILLSGHLAAIQAKAGDLAGVRDTRVRIMAAQRKVTDPLSKTLAEAELAIAAWNLGDKDGYVAHLTEARQLGEACPPGQRGSALRAVMTAQLKGKQYDGAVETAKQLRQLDAGTTGEVSRLFGELGAGDKLVPLAKQWWEDSKKISDPAKRSAEQARLAILLVNAKDVPTAEELARQIEVPDDRATALTAAAIARYKEIMRTQYDRDIAQVNTAIEQESKSLRGLAYARLADAQALANDKDGAERTIERAKSAPAGFDPMTSLMQLARAEQDAGDIKALAATLSAAEDTLKTADKESAAQGYYQIAKFRAETGDTDGAQVAVTLAERAGSETLGYRTEAITAIAAALALEGKADAAQTEAQSLKDPTARDEAYAAVCLALANKGDLNGALTTLVWMSDVNARRQVYPKMVRAVAGSADIDTVEKFVQQMPGGPAERTACYLIILDGLTGR
jgi:hypothetical protein